MSPEEQTLASALQILSHLGIPHMLTGSMATSFHGHPRATHDADIVIDPTPEQVDGLIRAFEDADFYVDAPGARDALTRRRQFNVIDTAHGCKVDLIVMKDRPFSREELRRRQQVDLSLGQPVAIVTPEDAVLSKLEWARRSGDSERQLRDAAGVVELNPQIDRSYIAKWAEQLGVSDLWDAIDGSRPGHPGG